MLKRSEKRQKISTATVTKIGMLSAVAAILMFLEVPLFFAPAFYKLDFSEVPVLVGCFALGPLCGVAIEFIKVFLHFIVKGAETAGVGEVANFLIGCAMCLPASLIYQKMRTKKGAIIGLASGTAFMTAAGCLINAYILLPTYAKAFQMPLDALVDMARAVNPSIHSISTLMLFAVVPFNILKGVLVSAVVVLIYKKLSPILKMK